MDATFLALNKGDLCHIILGDQTVALQHNDLCQWHVSEAPVIHTKEFDFIYILLHGIMW